MNEIYEKLFLNVELNWRYKLCLLNSHVNTLILWNFITINFKNREKCSYWKGIRFAEKFNDGIDAGFILVMFSSKKQ